jgi:hypothetical protein
MKKFWISAVGFAVLSCAASSVAFAGGERSVHCGDARIGLGCLARASLEGDAHRSLLDASLTIDARLGGRHADAFSIDLDADATLGGAWADAEVRLGRLVLDVLRVEVDADGAPALLEVDAKLLPIRLVLCANASVDAGIAAARLRTTVVACASGRLRVRVGCRGISVDGLLRVRASVSVDAQACLPLARVCLEGNLCALNVVLDADADALVGCTVVDGDVRLLVDLPRASADVVARVAGGLVLRAPLVRVAATTGAWSLLR